MVSVGLCILHSVAMIETIFKLSQMYAILLDKSSGNTTMGPPTSTTLPDEESKIDVGDYARHWLCKDVDAQKYFYKAVKTRFCSLSLTFIANHVIDLCRTQDSMLEKWVKELFDFDGDGYITHLERTYYTRLKSRTFDAQPPQ